MKEETSGPRENGLTPCSLSGQCIFVVDELEYLPEQHAVFSGREENALHSHQQLLIQMQAHIPTCPTCTETLTQLRQERDQQRILLHTLLAEGEHDVPSTVASILSLVKQEQLAFQTNHTQQPATGDANNTHDTRTSAMQPLTRKTYPSGQVKELPRPQVRQHHRMRWLRTAVAVAAVLVLLLGSLAVFSRFILFHNGSSTSLSSTSNTSNFQTTQSWSSVVMTSVSNHQLIIGNYDPLSGSYSELGGSNNPDGVVIDGVAHSGYAVLYHSYDGKKTEYRIVPQDITLYTAQGHAGPAVWSTDDRFIFISTSQGILQANAVNRSTKLIVSASKVSAGLTSPIPVIHFYRSGYLYFSAATQKGTMGALQRIALSDNAVQTVATCENIHDFWLSPYGATVYYACGKQDAVYAVNSDGSQPRIFRTQVGRLIGFAQDDSLITLSVVNAVSRVVKLGSNPALDTVLLNTLAPQALPVTAEDVAVAPYGTALVARGTYSDNTQKVWYGNLLNGQQQLMPVTMGVVQLVGWSRLLVPTTTPLVQPTQPLSLSEWHQVLIVSRNGQGMTLSNDDTHNDSSVVVTGATKLPASTIVDGISSDGKNALYHFSSGGHTFYSTLSPIAKTGYFYELNDEDAGNAIWLPNSQYALISTINTGVKRVNVQTGETMTVLPQLQAAKLVLYRAPYVYFVGGEDRATGALYRVNLNEKNAIPQQVTLPAPHATFWLSPDGNMVYYVNTGSAGQAGVYAVKSDGSNFAAAQPLRKDGVPIGYAADNALMMIRHVQGKFQVVKLGATAQQDQVVLSDVAPGAVRLCDTSVATGITAICDDSVALAPLGGKLVVAAGYADGQHMLWSIDLATAAHFQLPTSVSLPGEHWQLVGWNQIMARDS